MTAEEVIVVLDSLQNASIDAWLDGGWGVDALLEEQTRPHDDLDLVISLDCVHKAARVLEVLGFQIHEDELPTRFVVRSGGDAWVVLNHYRCDLGDKLASTRVRIGTAGAIPAEMTSITITDPYRQLDYCGKGDPGSTLTVSPFEPSLRAAFSTG